MHALHSQVIIDNIHGLALYTRARRLHVACRYDSLADKASVVAGSLYAQAIYAGIKHS